MKLEKGEYKIIFLDIDEYEISYTYCDNLREAKKLCKNRIEEKELVSVGLFQAKIYNFKGDCIEHLFTKANSP